MFLEVMKGTLKQNAEYCSKEHRKDPTVPFFRSGELDAIPNGPGARTDIKTLLGTYRSYGELLDNDPAGALKCRQVARDFYQRKAVRDHSTRDIKVYWFFGETGSGKTLCAKQFMEDHCPGDWFFHTGSFQWMDGYDGQRGVLFDEFRRNQLTDNQGMAWLLKITDRDKFLVPVKGAMVLFVADIIVLTSNVDPVAMFTYRRLGRSGEYEDYVDDHVNQLVRRIRTVAEFRRNDELGTITYTDRTRAIQLKAGLEHWVRRDNPPAIPDLGPLF